MNFRNVFAFDVSGQPRSARRRRAQVEGPRQRIPVRILCIDAPGSYRVLNDVFQSSTTFSKSCICWPRQHPHTLIISYVGYENDDNFTSVKEHVSFKIVFHTTNALFKGKKQTLFKYIGQVSSPKLCASAPSIHPLVYITTLLYYTSALVPTLVQRRFYH